MSPVTGEMGGCNQSKKVTERYEKKDNDSISSHDLILVLWRDRVKREVSAAQSIRLGDPSIERDAG
jgi:hypothetical protein